MSALARRTDRFASGRQKRHPTFPVMCDLVCISVQGLRCSIDVMSLESDWVDALQLWIRFSSGLGSTDMFIRQPRVSREDGRRRSLGDPPRHHTPTTLHKCVPIVGMHIVCTPLLVTATLNTSIHALVYPDIQARSVWPCGLSF